MHASAIVTHFVVEVGLNIVNWVMAAESCVNTVAGMIQLDFSGNSFRLVATQQPSSAQFTAV